MFGLSNETQKKIGYVLIAGGIGLGGYAAYKHFSKPKKKNVGMGNVNRQKKKREETKKSER